MGQGTFLGRGEVKAGINQGTPQAEKQRGPNLAGNTMPRKRTWLGNRFYITKNDQFGYETYRQET